MASTTIADYQVLSDGSFTLDTVQGGSPNEATLNFEVPSDFAFESGVRKPILTFNILPFEDSNFKVFLNHREVASFNFDKSHTRGHQEAFSATTAFPNGSSFSNPVPLRIFLSSGKIRLSDVVVWYQIKRNP